MRISKAFLAWDHMLGLSNGRTLLIMIAKGTQRTLGMLTLR